MGTIWHSLHFRLIFANFANNIYSNILESNLPKVYDVYCPNMPSKKLTGIYAMDELLMQSRVSHTQAQWKHRKPRFI